MGDLAISSLEGVELLANHASYIDPIVLEAEDGHEVYFQKAACSRTPSID